MISEPVKADNFVSDGEDHSAFKSAGEVNDPDNFKIYYAVSTDGLAPDEKSTS